MTIYRLTAEDYTSVGGPMGMVETPVILDEFFSTVDKAKAFALKDYQKRESKGDGQTDEEDGEGKRVVTTRHTKATFKFKKQGRGWTSGDLCYISYSIYPVKVR